MEKKPGQTHTGHRRRLRERYHRDGLDGFEDHQALELLLFYAVPRRDTNELAHRLIDAFGSLKNLFEADSQDIMRVEGVGEKTAALIKLLPDLANKYWFSPETGRVRIDSVESAGRFFKAFLYGKPTERLYVACLDPSYRVKSVRMISGGTPSQTPVSVRHIAEAALRSGSEMILLAHNHPGGSARPSKQDIETTARIHSAMEALRIRLLDHIIISGDEYFSVAAQGLPRGSRTASQAGAAQYSSGPMRDIFGK